ncbi:unnamed protein product [Pleuronectes platessa]|uniref:Uncharacterized protein n=1 Tax=Pleuronectes platessa TaxID=8262 RepID=A0A9N7YMJ1_PLEPL|nr:unnamed protein product [Pleuronectes platessa]
MPHVLEWTQSPKMPQCHTKVSRTTRVNSYWSLWSKTCEVTGANIRRGGGLADPASFSIQPTTGGRRCSSQLTPLKEISSPFKLYKTPRSDAMSCRRTSTSI